MKCTTFWGLLNQFSCFNSYYHLSPHESQKPKKDNLAPKTNPKPNFESRFGFLVKFYPFPELGFKISGLERKKMNLYPFFAFLDHCGSGTGNGQGRLKNHVRVSKTKELL